MAFEVPTDLIREVQTMLRNHAGIPTYDPDDPSLPPLPSLDDAISGFEPSPPYLRCKNCNGRFLRGLASLICVYCGQEQRKELPPEPIKFTSTVGYRWLLDALNLDGSEIVGPSIEELESNRGKSIQKDEVSLSDLLDLEIKWPDESVNVGNGVTDTASIQSKPSLNLAGVDLDNFFSESKDTVASEEHFGSNTLFRDTESNAFQGQKDLNLFENVQHSETAIRTSVNESGDRFAVWQTNSTESSTLQGHENLSLVENIRPSETAVHSSNIKSGDRFSGWEAEFQPTPASSETIHGDSSSFDPFGGSTVDLSAHMDTVFGPVNDAKHVKPEDDSALPASTTNNYIQDDIWTNFNSGVSYRAEQVEAATSIGWIQDDQLQGTKAPNNDPKMDDDDSFDAWNDFTSSTNAPEPSDGPWKQSTNQTILSAEHTSEKNLFGSTNNLQSMEFGSSEQPDLFTGAFNDKNVSKEVNIMQSEASALGRIPDESTKDGARIGEDHIKETMSSEADDVKNLMSQMHDLSFMLESNLSIPKS